MPGPVNLAGRRLGRLLVLSRAEDLVSASGKSRRRTWLCRCDCGREEVFPQDRLPYVPSNAARSDAAECCTHCRSQRVCVVCGGTFEALHYRATCSEACARANQRAIDLAFYRRQMAIDPNRNRKILAERKARAASDPAYAEHLRAQRRAADQRKRERIKADPQRRASLLARARERYHRDRERHRARINARLRAKLESMSDAEYEAWLEQRRAYWRAYAREQRGTPEGRERYRQAMRDFRAQQALRKLLRVGVELQKRIGDE